MERSEKGVGASDNLANRKRNDNKGDCRHQKAEADVTSSLDPRLAGGELARVDAVNGLIAQQQGQIRHRVEDGVGHSSEQRQRAGRDRTIHLDNTQDNVGRETSIHGDFVFEAVFGIEFPRGADVLLDRLEHTLDGLVLRLVETAQLARDERLFALGARVSHHLHHTWTVGIALTSSVGFDLADFLFGFELRCKVERVSFGRVARRRPALLIGPGMTVLLLELGRVLGLDGRRSSFIDAGTHPLGPK